MGFSLSVACLSPDEFLFFLSVTKTGVELNLLLLGTSE
jgi:hypothetical protein